MEIQQALEQHGLPAIEAGELGIWDLRPELETVHHSPQLKRRLGFPEPHAADNTHFWRCRVHPEDLGRMLDAMRAHMSGDLPSYEAKFRLRSNGSGYRLVHSRGRVIERGPDGRATRLVGTMIDLTGWPATPREGLPDGPGGCIDGLPPSLPFHLLLTAARAGQAGDEARQALIRRERERVLDLVEDLLHASLMQLGLARD